MRHPCTHITKAQIQKTGNTKCCEGWWTTGAVTHRWWAYRMGESHWRVLFLTKLKTDHMLQQLHLVLSEGTKKICPHKNLDKDTSTSFILNSPNWKQPWYSSVGEGTNKLYNIQQQKSAITKNKWMTPFLSNRSRPFNAGSPICWMCWIEIKTERQAKWSERNMFQTKHR